VASTESLYRWLRDEITELEEAGCKVDGLRQRLQKAKDSQRSLLALYERMCRLKPHKSYPYEEPSGLEEIKETWGKAGWRPPRRISRRTLADRLLGALQGRCAGCLLGKPVEGEKYEAIKQMLTATDDWPLRNYFRSETLEKCYGPERLQQRPELRRCCRGRIREMVRDDDIDYTILGLHILQQYGPDFTTENVGSEWLSRLPYHRVYTAERCAYRNLVNQLPIDQVGQYLNPYREWIGAQIRCDGFAYAAAGMPALAAEFAWRDAWLSHRKNGIYGEMYFAAVIAAALVCDSVIEALEVGLEYIPQRSRLAEAIAETLRWSQEDEDWEQTFRKIKRRFGRYHPVHTINNAAVVVMALVHGKDDFGQTIGIAVSAGWDTDCNGATAGSVIGAILGARKLPARWIRPLRDTIRSEVRGYDGVSMSRLAAMAADLHRKISN